MDRKFNRSRKLLMGMMVLVIIMSIEVQAIDIISTTFHLSSISISLPHLSKLDYFIANFIIALQKKLHVVPTWNLIWGDWQCFILGFHICIDKRVNLGDPDYQVALRCLHACNKREKTFAFYYGICLLAFYQWNL